MHRSTVLTRDMGRPPTGAITAAPARVAFMTDVVSQTAPRRWFHMTAVEVSLNPAFSSRATLFRRRSSSSIGLAQDVDSPPTMEWAVRCA